MNVTQSPESHSSVRVRSGSSPTSESQTNAFSMQMEEEEKKATAQMSPKAPSILVQVLSIGQWWFFNVATVILNKYIFQVLGFKFPLSLSTVHFIMSSVGAYLFLQVFKVKPLVEVKPVDQWSRVFPMAVVFCINIVLGNVSLSSIPVSFMQTIKSFTPATTVLLQRLVWGRRFDYRVYLALLPVIGGIVLTSVTELSFVWLGFMAALIGCFVTSTKTILAEMLLHGKYNFDSLNTVYHMAPYATMILIAPAAVFEGPGVMEWLHTTNNLTYSVVVILISGVIAFSLNYSIFYVIQTTSALTFNVAGNMKTAVAIVTSWMLFHNPMNALNWIGCTITLVGCTFYGYVRQVLGSKAAVDAPKEVEQQPLIPLSSVTSS